MARAIVVTRDGRESRFGFTPVDRAKLYGQRKRVVVDEQGQPCATGYLTVDGSALLLAESRAMLYLDEHSDVIDRGELSAVDAEGRPLVKVESTLDVAQTLAGPVPPQRVLDTNVVSVYRLDPAGPDPIDEDLAAGLARGEIWETTFNYMAGYERQTLFLLQNQDGLFALVCEPAAVQWLDRQAPPPSDVDPMDGDDLDFTMF